MRKDKTAPEQGDNLRRRPGEEKSKKKSGHVLPAAEKDFSALLQELHLIQFELEMQNEELRKAQVELEESRNKFVDLYDFAPTGYLTLNGLGLIMEANLTACRQLNVERSRLIGRLFTLCVVPEDREVLHHHLRQVSEVKDLQTCEVRLLVSGGNMFHAVLRSIQVQDSSGSYFYRTSVTDISDRLQAEETMRESERRFREMLENVDLLALCLDSEGKITFCNDHLLETTDWKHINVVGRDWFADFVPPEVRDQIKQVFCGAIMSGDLPPHYENEILTRSGERRIISWNNIFLRGPQGSTVGTASIGEDITEKKQIEKELRESKALFEILARMSPVGIFRTDIKGDCLYVNERWCEISGLTVEEALGEGWVKAIHPGDRHRVFGEWYRSAQDDRPFRSEYRFLRPDGRSTWVLGQASAELYPTGEVVGYVGTVTDITEQKQTEEALQEARDKLEHRVLERTAELFVANEQLKKEMEERRQAEDKISETNAMLQTVFNGISEPLLMLEKNLSVKMLNEAACKYFQVSNLVDFAGTPCYELAGGRCAPCDNCVIRSAIGGGKSITFERNGLFDPDRSELVAVYPAEEVPHGFSGAIIRISDITENRNLERHLLREDRLSSLGQLAGGIAHQIRNPLSGINLFVHILSDQKKFNRTSEELKILGEIKNNTRKIDAVIKRVLDFSRQSAKVLHNLEVGALIEDALEFWRSRIRKEGIKLTVSIEENLPKVMGDPVEVRQVLNNLVQNAVESMGKGGALDITAKRGVLSINERRTAVMIQIKDNGRGIPLEQQESIFNPFFTTKATGTGLGLAISQRIVTRLGGTLSFESTPGKGTAFCVEFPTASRD